MDPKLYLYCASGLFTLAIVVYIFLIRKKLASNFSHFISDILKEKADDGEKYSQGRFYLLVSLIFYFLTLTMISVKGVMPQAEMNTKSFEQVIEALQWIVALFSGYVFGTKGLEVLSTLMKLKIGKTKEEEEETATENKPDPEV